MRWTTAAAPSASYSWRLIQLLEKVDKLAMTEQPIHADISRSGGAMTLTIMPLEGASLASSALKRSGKPVASVGPPASRTFPTRSQAKRS